MALWKPTTTTKMLLSTVYISITFPFLFDAYRHFISYLCYFNWYTKINTLNACNHLATSPTSQKHVHLIVTPILVLIFQLFLSSFVCDQNIFFLKYPIQKFMHHFDFFSGIWSNPLYTRKPTYERYKFHVEPLTVIYLYSPPPL